VKRPDDPHDPAGEVSRGALPAYCIEVRKGAGNSINRDYPTAASAIGGSIAQCNFVGGPCPSGGITLSVGDNFLFNTTGGLSSKLTDPGTAPRLDSITKFPEDKSDPNDVISQQPGSGLDYWRVYPELHLNNERFRNAPPPLGRPGATMRVADMLLPMCIGPTQVPDPTLTPDQRWITFGETLALALNYADIDPAIDPQFAFLDSLARDSAGRPATDRGNVRLDRFVPFEDKNTSGTYDPPTGAATDDAPRAPRVPLGATVLDVFRTIDPDLGSLERGVQGLVNLNTAPSRVLKAEPMACPNPGTGDYWGTGPQLPVPATFGTTTGSDYAAAIEAFRDKTLVTALDGQSVTFQESAGANLTLDDPTVWDGRTITNQDPSNAGANIEPIREAPGLASLGELFGATQHPNQPPNPVRVPPLHRIDELGNEQPPNNSGDVGVNSTLYRAVGASSAAVPTVINEIRDDYAEKLAVVGSIAGTSSVRSDTFACWMVIHGYQRSDCEGLSSTAGQADPLSPTIAKRYLMIVDRSNVTRLGDKPRILMMQEVPF
jgi:hypothetical protein